MRQAVFVFAVTCLWLSAPAPARGALLAVNFATTASSSQLFRVDEATGLATPIGITGSSGLNSLAQSPTTGQLFTVGTASGLSQSSNVLLRLNPTTGAATPIAVMTLGGGRNVSIRDMAFSPAGVLYAVNADNPPGAGVFAVPELFTINPSTGVGTLVGPLNQHLLQGLAFSPAGVLYGYALNATVGGNGAGLVRVDPATAAVTDVNPAIPGTSVGQALTFAPDGTLYGGNGMLIRIDPATAVETPIGLTGADLRGLAVPEPSSAIAVAVASLVGVRRHRRRTAR